MTEESTSNFEKLLIACSAVHDARAALGKHNAPCVAVSSAFSRSGFTVPLQHPLGPLAAAASCDLTDVAVASNGVSNAPPPLLRASGETVDADNELLAAAAAAASATGDLTAATGIGATDIEITGIEGGATTSPAPDSSSSSSSLAPGTHVAGPRQALAAAPTAQQAAPPAPPTPESNNP